MRNLILVIVCMAWFTTAGAARNVNVVNQPTVKIQGQVHVIVDNQVEATATAITGPMQVTNTNDPFIVHSQDITPPVQSGRFSIRMVVSSMQL